MTRQHYRAQKTSLIFPNLHLNGQPRIQDLLTFSSRCKELDSRDQVLRGNGFRKTKPTSQLGSWIRRLSGGPFQTHIHDASEHHTFGSYLPLCALGAGKHQPRVRQVIAQVHVGPAAQNPASFLQRDIRFYGNGVGTNDWPAGTSLTLDFPTFSISGRARTDSPPRGSSPPALSHVGRSECRRPGPPTSSRIW